MPRHPSTPPHPVIDVVVVAAASPPPGDRPPPPPPPPAAAQGLAEALLPAGRDDSDAGSDGAGAVPPAASSRLPRPTVTLLRATAARARAAAATAAMAAPYGGPVSRRATTDGRLSMPPESPRAAPGSSASSSRNDSSSDDEEDDELRRLPPGRRPGPPAVVVAARRHARCAPRAACDGGRRRRHPVGDCGGGGHRRGRPHHPPGQLRGVAVVCCRGGHPARPGRRRPGRPRRPGGCRSLAADSTGCALLPCRRAPVVGAAGEGGRSCRCDRPPLPPGRRRGRLPGHCRHHPPHPANLTACAAIACAASVVAAGGAKVLAGRFYARAHFDAMHDDLRKEFVLIALSAPPRKGDWAAKAAAVAAAASAGAGGAPPLAERSAVSLSAHAPLPQAEDDATLSRPTPPSPRVERSCVSASAAAGATAGGPLPPLGSDWAPATTWADAGAGEGGMLDVAATASPEAARAQAHASMADLARLLSSTVRPTGAMAPASATSAPPELPPRPAEGAAPDAAFLARLHRVERHIRSSRLRLTFADAMGAAAADAAADAAAGAGGAGAGAAARAARAEARRLAFFLFWNVSQSVTSTHVTLDDLAAFLTDPAAAKEAMTMLDMDGDGRISRDDMRDAVASVFEGRANLMATLRDARSVVGRLRAVLAAAAHAGSLLIYLAVWDVNVTRLWVTVSSALLSFVFVFVNSLRAIYESVVFLFVVHPFDVGDAVTVGVGGSGGEGGSHSTYRVEEVALLTTTLVRLGDGARVTWPNIKLAEGPLANLTRSGGKGDSVRFLVDAPHARTVVAAAKRGAAAAVAASPGDYATGDVSVNVAPAPDAAPGLKLAVTLWWRVAGRGDTTRALPVRTAVLLSVVAEFDKAGVAFTSAPMGPAPPAMED